MEKIIKVYDRENYCKLINEIKVVQLNKIDKPLNVIEIPLDNLNISNTLCCSFCKINFNDYIEQRQHCKSDWHRYNLKLNLKSQESIPEEKFIQLADDVSSISGSDSESDDNSEQENFNYVLQGKVFLKNSDEKYFSLYRSLLYEKKDAPANDNVLIRLVQQSFKNNFWTILMLSGGHFAGAIFNGSDILVHKTFHCYTVRAKQGGSQGSRDNKAGGVHPKSAGASLRRYNEQSLIQHITEVLDGWSTNIEKSNLIFYRAAGPYNRSVLFGSKNPILKKNDNRLRNIPFSTRRPTFTEVKRVHDVLTNVEVYGSLESFKPQIPVEKSEEINRQSRRESPKNKNINRAKSREIKERPLPTTEQETTSGSELDFNLSSENVELSFNELKEYGDSLTNAERQKKRKKKLRKKDRIKKWEENFKKELYKNCTQGKLEILESILKNVRETNENSESNLENKFEKATNMCIDEHGNTLMHIAALNAKSDIILWLLENNVNPCCKNDKLQTPYTINDDKVIRNVFRKFAAENPDKYDYRKAQIPINTSTLTEEELTEKKRAQRKVKREREKEKKKVNEIKRKEEDDRNRFINLSDREKRALAAERRLLSQTSTVLARCFLCGEDISGKVPFEYSGNRFCSITCLKAHRMQNPIVLS